MFYFYPTVFFRVLVFLIPDLGPIIRIIFVVMVSGGWCHLLFLWVSSLQYRAGVEKRKLAGVFARICLIRVILTFKTLIYFLCCATKRLASDGSKHLRRAVSMSAVLFHLQGNQSVSCIPTDASWLPSGIFILAWCYFIAAFFPHI